MTRTIVVTGANGFVGRAVCEEVVKRGYGLRALVRAAERSVNVPGELAIAADLSTVEGRSEVLSGADALIHLAARVHVMKDTAADPLAEFRAVNVRLTESLAKAAAANGVKRFVYVSSIKVNGEETRERPFTPDDRPSPQDAYAQSKLEAEYALGRIAMRTGLEVTIVRPPLVYGARVGGNFLRLMKLIDLGVPLPFQGVNNRRSMIYSRNLADALLACVVGARAAGRTFLVSDGEDISTGDLIQRIASALGKPSRCFRLPLAALELAGRCTGKSAEIQRLVSSLVVDSGHIRDALEWTPPVALDLALVETAHWYRLGADRPSTARI